MNTMAENNSSKLPRTVGLYGLMFVSLGSIIGSGWLLGALNAAKVAGPASILSWILSAAMLALLALTYAELGATYPVAGGAGRFPYYSHGPIAGFTAGWASWLQAVFIPPIEVLAVLTYVNSVGWVNTHFNMINRAGENAGLLNGSGLVVAVVLMVLFTAMNLLSAKLLSDSNAVTVIWKTAVPVLALGVVAWSRFTPSNFQAGGGLNPKDIMNGWTKPLGTDPSDYGAWYTLALAVGAGWLATILMVNAVISPAATGVVYMATTARLSYALGEEREMPSTLARTNDKGVPVVSILVAAV